MRPKSPGITIYIPLCFYFICHVCHQKENADEFTFHYASTLSYTIIWNSLALTIYIPLCFYFIRRWDWYRGLVLYNLHSTMLLLYPGGQGSAATVTVFTFHYASTLSAVDPFPVNPFFIYIPLCFYFIRVPLRSLGILLHLHSTMLLLYLIVVDLVLCSAVIYIPLCFYFISFRSFSSASSVNLHSTMLLLYLLSLLSGRCYDQIYIPLCFYFIGVRKDLLVYHSAIYIPLCFYFI